MLDISPQTVQMVQAVAIQKGVSVDELILNAIGHYSHDVMLNSESNAKITVDNATFDKLLAILDEPPAPTPAMQELMAKYGGVHA